MLKISHGYVTPSLSTLMKLTFHCWKWILIELKLIKIQVAKLEG
jgi:hypothetical protein